MPRLSFRPLDNAPYAFLHAFWNRSTSSSVVVHPTLTRKAAWVKGGAKPIPSSTWEAWTFPDEQAAPEDTATPSRSSDIIAVSALTPGTANIVVFGSRGASAPKTIVSGATA